MADKVIGFVGLGAMGGGMAKVLVRGGFTVHCYDIYPPSVQNLVDVGGKAEATPADVAKSADIVAMMVVGPAHVNSALFDQDSGAIYGFRQGAILIITSTVPPGFCAEIQDRIANEFQRPDVTLLDCPVSGGTTGAASGTLTIFGSGPEEGLKRAQPVLSCLADKLYTIAGGIGSGSKAKMCHQIPAEVQIALTNEVMAFAAKAGLNTQETFDAVQASDGYSWINGNRIIHMLEGDKRVYSALPNSLKDTSIIVNHARIVSHPVFLSATAEQIFDAGISAGWGPEDDSTLWRLYLSSAPDDAIFQMTKAGCKLFERTESITIQDIIDVFAGTHLAIAAETMGFTHAVGLDTSQMYKIFRTAAGASTQFDKQVPKMKAPTWSLRDVPEAPGIKKRLESALIKSISIGAPMPLAAVALQIIQRHLQ
ncbi:hypothetical protein QQS21_011701 [Conoideocrella luteorostrata]|uniref:3-hydroxyisobutyrate dehydrogenase n=1 Tax=Conoideocrella luteorostrata TaxID=1105319 RepID=A0AAJ0CCL2_9HYPO|nr:hypothetical protein QQS21_011701 [Conoideocrella luteorostrata]